MKKIYYLLLILSFSGKIFGQIDDQQLNREENISTERETVTEVQAEKEISVWLEDMLYPIIGKTIVIVDLKLKFPALQQYGTAYDQPGSLPGLPVSRSKGIMTAKVGDETILPTAITQKRITVFVDKNVKNTEIDFIETKIMDWFNIDTSAGDLINVFRSNKKFIEPKSSLLTGMGMWPLLLVFLIVSIAIFLLLSSNIKNGFRFLIRSMEIANKQNAPAVSGSMPHPNDGRSTGELENLQITQKKPLPITIIEKDNENGNDQLNFDFLEDLEPKHFAKLMHQESPPVLALIMQRIPSKYSTEIFKQFPNDSEVLLKNILNPSKEYLSSLPAIREKLLKQVELIKRESLVDLDGSKTLTSIINSCDPTTASNLLKQLAFISKGQHSQIRRKILLLEDIVRLDDKIIEGLIRGISHQQLILFLASVGDEIRNKFYKNMTPRAVSIIKEDIEIMGEPSNADKINSVQMILQMFRKVLKFN